MKEVKYSCDKCNKDLGPNFSDAKSDRGAVELSLSGALYKDESWAARTEKQFCSVSCVAEYMGTLAKELIAQNVIDQ